MLRKGLFPVVWIVIASAGLLASGDTTARVAETTGSASTDNLAREARRILSDKCFQCHGPDENARQADLRLDLEADAAEVLSADAPDQSELLRHVASTDPDEQMPPPESKLSLSAAEIETLRAWVRGGASFEQHWAFVPLQPVAVPEVARTDWPINAIDRFILARLEREGLSPSAEASRERLIRRLSFDLTGLPPTLAEIDAYLADDSPEAYERLVDRLLSKTEYGERMAAAWLDVARYSDTYGYQVDRDRFVWPWRDWVIRAWNANMPYDDFVRWQLAGDLLPDATDDQILATTFNRLHPQKVEGGSVPEEFRTEYVADRVHTFATAFLGLTMECARCHDHKFDPIRQREYYQLFAFFNNIDEAGLYSYFTSAVPTPTLVLADDGAKHQFAQLRQNVAAEEEKLQATAAARRDAFEAWLADPPADHEVPGRIAHLDFEQTDVGGNARVPGHAGQAVRLTGDDAVGLEVGNFRRFDPFSIALWLNTPDVKQRAVVFHRSRAWTDAGSRGYQLLIEDGKLSASLIHFWPGNAVRVRTREPIATGEWLHVAVTSDGSGRASGLQIFIDGQPADCEVVRDTLSKNIIGGGGDNIAIGARFRDRGFTNGLVDEFQVFDRQLTPIEVAQLHDGHSLADAMSDAKANSSGARREALLAYFLATVDADYQAQLSRLRAARASLCEMQDKASEIMVMRELSEPRSTFVLNRGAYDAPGEPVSPDTPAVFPPFPPDQPRNRLGLANWLTSADHPLAPRVAVNRLWQLCLGHGLMRTPEDFGSQGDPPTHPALLDWLARDFVDHGWDVKRTLKQIVMSATYRQSSVATPELFRRDPENHLYARAPRHRLGAEMIRDSALAASGLLVRNLGGPPVRPYEVAVSFKPVERDKDQGIYRRSVYTYWKRTAPAPVMMSLDASKRDVCSVKRERTSSSLQALVLLNDPQLVEAARMLAQHVVLRHGDDTGAAIDDVFRILTARHPTDRQREILERLYREQLDHFQSDPSRAERFLTIGDAPRDESIDAARLAALGVVASAVMNLDECVMRR